MSATIIPLLKGSGRRGPSRASGRVEARTLLPAANLGLEQVEALRQAHQHIAEAWRLKAESAAIRRRYEERQKRIEVLMAKYPDVERV
jgi:hypothetical protein